VDLDSCYLLFQVGQFLLNQPLDKAREALTPFDAAVSANFDVHVGSPLKISTPLARFAGWPHHSIRSGEVA
jgi:hypothetical protein